MKTNKLLTLVLFIILICAAFASCGQKSDNSASVTTASGQSEITTEAQGSDSEEQTTAPSNALPDGVYTADFKTNGSMFHVNEAYDGKGVLTVQDGKMVIHISLPSKNTVNLFLGTAADAQLEGAQLINPTIDLVTYSDGTTEEVNGFDIPVPYLNDEFDCALVGTKGKWYDHKVSVSNPILTIADGKYTAEVTLTGGSGKASINSPAELTVINGTIFANIVWSSSHYEYMNIGETRYDRVDTEGNSTFIIPITLDKDINISALTTAMSEPHLIEYTLHFDGNSLKSR